MKYMQHAACQNELFTWFYQPQLWLLQVQCRASPFYLGITSIVILQLLFSLKSVEEAWVGIQLQERERERCGDVSGEQYQVSWWTQLESGCVITPSFFNTVVCWTGQTDWCAGAGDAEKPKAPTFLQTRKHLYTALNCLSEKMPVTVLRTHPSSETCCNIQCKKWQAEVKGVDVPAVKTDLLMFAFISTVTLIW